MAKITRRAFIIEEDCIGCNRCVSHCPVDCIIGAPKMLHTIFAQECIGCGLCIAPCPVDCIIVQEIELSSQEMQDLAGVAKYRHRQKVIRQQSQQQLVLTMQNSAMQTQAMRDEIANAISRQQEKKYSVKIYGA